MRTGIRGTSTVENGQEISLQEIQKLEVQVLSKFIDYCKAHDLKYYIAYGSLIGAIRHKGFIPWDDDIDVIMPRYDYEKLLGMTDRVAEHMLLASRYNRPQWPYLFAKCYDSKTEMVEEGYDSGVIGVYIDIFPVDGLPNNIFFRKLHMYWLRFLYGMFVTVQKDNLKATTPLRAVLKKILFPLANYIGRIRLRDYIDYFIRCHPFSESEFVAVQSTDANCLKQVMKCHVYSETAMCKFENLDVIIPGGYDEMLRTIYGDYMKLPPVEQQVSHHNYVIRLK